VELFVFCLSCGVVIIKNYNIKASKEVEKPLRGLIMAPSENIESLVPPEG